MKVYYIKCSKCNQLKPKATYFLSKEQSEKLKTIKRQNELCYECIENRKIR